MCWDCVAYKFYWLRDHYQLVARSDHTTGYGALRCTVRHVLHRAALRGTAPHRTLTFHAGHVAVCVALHCSTTSSAWKQTDRQTDRETEIER